MEELDGHQIFKARLIYQLSHIHSAERRSNSVTRVAVVNFGAATSRSIELVALSGYATPSTKSQREVSRNASNVDECCTIAQFR
jgi:hypothetical protein